MVTATWCNANVLNLFWITIGASKAPFSLLPLTPLQDWNQPRAPTTQTIHSGHALVQWGSCGDHLVAGVNTRLHLPNLRAKVVRREMLEKNPVYGAQLRDSYPPWPSMEALNVSSEESMRAYLDNANRAEPVELMEILSHHSGNDYLGKPAILYQCVFQHPRPCDTKAGL